MPKPLSVIQTKIYEFIKEYTRESGRPPTNREIGKAVGIESTGHVDYHLNALEKLGWIIRERRKSRGIRLAHEEPHGLRVTGEIAAGAPLEIYDPSQQETLDLCAHSHDHEYMLRVRGKSMIEDQIADGDYVLVDNTAHVSDGDIIVATHRTATGEHGAATLKRIYKESGRIRLQPANSTMKPIYITASEWDGEWEVQGKVTAVYRRF